MCTSCCVCLLVYIATVYVCTERDGSSSIIRMFMRWCQFFFYVEEFNRSDKKSFFLGGKGAFSFFHLCFKKEVL